MPSEKYVPKHRSAPVKPARTLAAKGVRGSAVLSGVAVAATGLAVSTGVLSHATPTDNAAMALSAGTPHLSEAQLAARTRAASRSTDDRQVEADRIKVAALSNDSGAAVTHSEDLSTADPRTIAKALLPQYGFSSSEFSCLDAIYTAESGWNPRADNPTSSAYGIPQALPGSKMASAGSDWETNPETQIRWGLGYIKDRYGTPCAALSFREGHGWY
ncbi:MAG: transglycosylase SLT domain-containing protein [Marmoricola sp.]